MTKSIVRIAGVVGAGLLVITVAFSRAGSAETPECWVDVINDFAVDTAFAGALPATADEAVEQGLRDIVADDAESRRRGDRESVSVDPEVFSARRALYAGARRGTRGPSGSSEFQWVEGGRVKGVIVMEHLQRGGWRITEEHFLVGDGPCGA